MIPKFIVGESVEYLGYNKWRGPSKVVSVKASYSVPTWLSNSFPSERWFYGVEGMAGQIVREFESGENEVMSKAVALLDELSESVEIDLEAFFDSHLASSGSAIIPERHVRLSPYIPGTNKDPSMSPTPAQAAARLYKQLIAACDIGDFAEAGSINQELCLSEASHAEISAAIVRSALAREVSA